MALVSKVNALMRRLSKVQAQIMSSGEITVHMKTMQVYKGDEPVTLSKKEFSLLLYLWENAGQIVSKESILEHVWDIDGQFVDDTMVSLNKRTGIIALSLGSYFGVFKIEKIFLCAIRSFGCNEFIRDCT